MHRTQIYLDDLQYRFLRETAQRQKKSLAKVIREIIEERLTRARTAGDPFLKVIGSAPGPKDNISERYEDYLYGPEPRGKSS